jgi:FixJ family two-component response regulator
MAGWCAIAGIWFAHDLPAAFSPFSNRYRLPMTDHPRSLIIAVVDDDLRMLQSLESLLESAGHTVRLFDSAAALLKSGALAEIDCLLSDVNMPVMGGLELLRIVRVARPELPVILVTGHPEMISHSPLAGEVRYQLFTKPFKPEELLAAISNLVPGPD